MSKSSSTAVGVIVAVLIIGAIASIGYYQVVVVGSKASSTTSTTTSTTQAACTPTTCAYVNISAGASGCTNASDPCGFSPATITVVLGVNNTVIWTNYDAAVHTVTPVTGSAWGSSEDPGIMPNGNYTYTFSSAGTYNYHCIYHAGMLGEVIVKS